MTQRRLFQEKQLTSTMAMISKEIRLLIGEPKERWDRSQYLYRTWKINQWNQTWLITKAVKERRFRYPADAFLGTCPADFVRR